MVSKTIIKSIIADPLKYFQKNSSDHIAEILIYLNDKFFNGEAEVSDNVYDILKDLMEEKYPDHPVLKLVGAPIEHNKVDLPYWMGSMDKKKTESEVTKFSTEYKGEYVISDKLDGISALLLLENNSINLYTRGNGTAGSNISHLIPFLGIDSLITKCFSEKEKEKKIAIRGELLLSKNNFELVKYLGANGRNMVSGIVNAKNPDLSILKLIDFVAYEIIEPRLKPEDQMKRLKKCGFKLVENSKTLDISYKI